MRATIIALAVVLTGAGLARPEFAGRAVQLLVAALTLAVVLKLLIERWDDVDAHIARPFVPPDPLVTSGVETPDVSELIRAAENCRGQLPPLITKHVAEACRGRLADLHRLHFHADADREAIQKLVSPEMWTVLNSHPDDTVDVSIRKLPQLLDEVEAL